MRRLQWAHHKAARWPEHGRALQQRGSLTVWVTPEAPAAWQPPRTGQHSGPGASATADGAYDGGSVSRPARGGGHPAISMDGKGAWRDNVFVERLWRSVKHEEIYLGAYDTAGEARASISRYLAFYNGREPHPSLDRKTPDQAYFSRLPQAAAA